MLHLATLQCIFFLFVFFFVLLFYFPSEKSRNFDVKNRNTISFSPAALVAQLHSCTVAVAQLLHTPLFLLICHALFNLGLGFFFHFDCCLRINEFIFLSFCSHSNSSTSLHVCLARKSFSNCSTMATRGIVEPDESFVRHLLRLVCANCAAVVVISTDTCCCLRAGERKIGREREKRRQRANARV